MIQKRLGDLLKQPDLTHIVHQCNLYNTFGSGLAAVIKHKYPEAYQADCATPKGDITKLGTFSVAETKDGKKIINLYSQVGISATERTTNYEAMVKGLTQIEHELNSFPNVVLGIPRGIGCGLANGSWDVVEPIIQGIFEKSPVKVVICIREDDLI